MKILLADRGSKIDILISLEVPEEELKRRLISRGEISGRSDDNEEVINKRIKEYKDKTEAVASYYHEKGKHIPLKGDGTIEETFDLIKTEIDKLV